MKIAALPLIALALLVSAHAKDKPEPAEAPPVISAEHRAEFFKRQLAATEAQRAYQAAQQALQGAVSELTKDCGDKFRPQMDPQGDPVCIAVPAPPAPKAK